MPLIQSSADSLPYIDIQPSTEALASADALIQAEMAEEDTDNLHPAIPKPRTSLLSDLVDTEHARLASGQAKESGVDLTRYEALDAPPKGDLEAWRATLQKAYASVEFLRGREINLGLLETYGKNAWLIGNSQLENLLRSLEREVDASKSELEAVEQARKAAQDGMVGEMRNLDETWRRGIGRMLETQAAAEGLKQQILEQRRLAAS